MECYKLLVVDDEETLCEVLKLNLENEGYDVDVAYSAEQALSMDIQSYSLILLDVMMGEISGFKMAKMLKSNHETANIPIIFCTAKETEDDMVMGLNIGADDYITKPYTIRNVLARVKSVLRRTAKNNHISENETISFESLNIDMVFKRCIVDGEEIKLTKKEFEILVLFLKNKGRIFSRDEILSKIWSDDVIVVDRTIDVNITRLRQKIGKYGQYIITRSGYGYGFKDKT
ncbi:MAG: response regulator transcription factor [Bacteroidales bacterium]|nr:response regulator transcription factor [Bacteroidales bacterium]